VVPAPAALAEKRGDEGKVDEQQIQPRLHGDLLS
jgi:hypothetical protein